MSGSRLGLLLFLCIFAIATRAESLATSTLKIENLPTDRKWSGEWRMGTAAGGFAEGKDEAAFARARLDLKFDYNFTSYLKAFVQPRLDLYASRVQARYDDDLYQNGIRMLDGYMSLHSSDVLELRAGSQNQGFLNNEMLISHSRSFPGLQERAGYDFNNSNQDLGVHFIAQQLVPTSHSMNTEREDKEPLPTFNTQTLQLNGRHFDTFEWKFLIGHYNWTNLPDKVAQESGMVGNSTLGDTPANAKFLYNYDGLFGGVEACLCWNTSPVQLVAEFQRIHNDRTDDGLGDAQMWGIGPRFVFGDRVFDIRYRRFFTEKDTTVALYSESVIGGTNRMGDDVEFKLDFKDMKFAVRGEWRNSIPIRDNDTQLTDTFMILGVETDYAPF